MAEAAGNTGAHGLDVQTGLPHIQASHHGRPASWVAVTTPAVMISLSRTGRTLQRMSDAQRTPVVPLEAEVLAPDMIAPLSHDEVRALPVYLGKRQCRLDDFFDVEGAGSE